MITSVIGVVLSWCTLLPRGATIYTSLTTMLPAVPVQQVDEVPVPVPALVPVVPGTGTGTGTGTVPVVPGPGPVPVGSMPTARSYS